MRFISSSVLEICLKEQSQVLQADDLKIIILEQWSFKKCSHFYGLLADAEFQLEISICGECGIHLCSERWSIRILSDQLGEREHRRRCNTAEVISRKMLSEMSVILTNRYFASNVEGRSNRQRHKRCSRTNEESLKQVDDTEQAVDPRELFAFLLLSRCLWLHHRSQ